MEAEELGAGVVEQSLFLPTTGCLASVDGEWEMDLVFFSFLLLFPLCLSLAQLHVRGIDRGRGQRKACNVPPPDGQWRGSGLYIRAHDDGNITTAGEKQTVKIESQCDEEKYDKF